MAKTDSDNIAELVEELINDVNVDRERLSDFLDRLLEADPLIAAEFIPKVAAELTRQNQVKVATIKALGKNLTASPDDDEDEISREIGRPFLDEVDESSN